MQKTNRKNLAILASTFFLVGAMFCMNDILFPSLMQLFKLSYTQATAVQMSFYAVYIIAPIPVSIIIENQGYKFAIILAVFMCAAGCVFFLPAYWLTSFELCLAGLFTLSFGIVILNVAANPYAAMLGNSEGSERRINFIQAFSRVGYAIIPVFATVLIYQNGQVKFHYPYLILFGALILIGVIMLFTDMPSFTKSHKEDFNFFKMIRQCKTHKHLAWGIAAMFFYVGAEASIAGFFINYLKTTNHFSDKEAASYLTIYNILATLFGFIAVILLRYLKGNKLIISFGLCIIVLFSIIIFTNNKQNGILLLAIGGFLGPMFPTIYGLSINGLEDFTNKGAALVTMAISGGAFFTPLQGIIADKYGIEFSYIVPLICFLMIVAYAIYYPFLYKQRGR
jgi:MFS transporter, FHS family, L-fucose permease